MSDRLILTEPVATGWLRTELRGDVQAAQGYIVAARRLLGGMKAQYGVAERQARQEAGGFYRQQWQLPGGVRVETLTNDGLDSIKITVPQRLALPAAAAASPQAESEMHDDRLPPVAVPIRHHEQLEWEPEWIPRKEEESTTDEEAYCVWETDLELYSPLIEHAEPRGAAFTIDHGGIYVAMVNGLVGNEEHAVDRFDYRTLSHVSTATAGNGVGVGDLGNMVADPNLGFMGVVTYSTDETAMPHWREAGGVDIWMLSDDLNGGIQMHFADALISQGFTSGGLAILKGGDFSGNDYYWVVSLRDQSVPLSLTNPSSFDNNEHMSGYTSDQGDAYFVVKDGGSGDPGIYRYGLASGINQTISWPGGSNSHGIAIDGDDGIWLRLTTGSGNDTLMKYSERDGWAEITERDTGGTALDLGAPVAARLSTLPYLSIMHDPISDAIAVLKGDLTGVWIFNAKDCMDDPILPFLFEITVPASPGDPWIPLMGTFHDGTLVLTLNAYDGVDYAGYRVARYDIGILKQTKIIKMYEDDMLVGSRVG